MVEESGVALEGDVVVLHLLHAPLVAVLKAAARLPSTGILRRKHGEKVNRTSHTLALRPRVGGQTTRSELV